MATVYKVLGQSNPSATTATTLYTVPSSTATVVSTITVANLGGSSATYRISVRPAAAAQTNAMYIAYDVTIKANTTTAYTLGITLDATDQVYILGSTTDISISLFGSEIS